MGKEAKYVVRLSAGERVSLEELIGQKRVAAEKALRARILLKADVGDGGPGWSDVRGSESLEVGESTVHRLRQRLVEEGIEAALSRKKRTDFRERKLDGAKEARLVAVACGPPPKGQGRCTLKLLADRLVELEVVESISDKTVRKSLKKTISSRRARGSGPL